MPRANRHFLPDHIWHITHRCHKKEFLLKFAQDRQHWRYWLYEARRRYGLCILNYIVTSNHVHLLVRDRGLGEIAKSMQLIAGRTAQAYNRRKARKGAFWEDRYHATAVDSDTYLARCMVYIDLNMVRAGVVHHPAQWRWSGYCEIQSPPERYRVIDQDALLALTGSGLFERYQQIHHEWVSNALRTATHERMSMWTESLAVGSREYVEGVQDVLGVSARHRALLENSGTCILREPSVRYKLF